MMLDKRQQLMLLSAVFGLALALPGMAQQAEAEPAADAEVAQAPSNLMGFNDQVGETFRFRVTGAASSAVWGSGVYTSDSGLAAAAVHAGVLEEGETGVVEVRMLPPMQAYAGEERNGVTSRTWGPFTGSFKFVPGDDAGPDADADLGLPPVMLDPFDMRRFNAQVGVSFRIRLTGTDSGNVWGTPDAYTSDSILATAAVHAGVLEVGETSIVQVRMIQPRDEYTAERRNGVTSLSWGAYPGAYKFVPLD